ncbi:sensor histidine kinase [Mariniflexile sp.]|uniref:sensor histidine kinase n=1 Tax=Mariniflexile sp. TaxID=1979402 RepID=UPI0040474824
MKLLVKTSLYYAIASLLFFTVAGFIILFNFNDVIDNDINDFLINREEIATTQIVNDIPVAALNNYEQIIKIVKNKKEIDNLIFKDTIVYDIIDDAFHSYRKLNVIRKIGPTFYDITIFKSLIESNLLITEILKPMLFVFLGLLIFLILGNLIISRGLWKPFKKTLITLENYELGSTKSIEFSETKTQEFNQLNTMLNSMIKKIHYDYLNLKEFTENAAHEIQTPLAIIRNKCEILLQSEKLSDNELKHTKSIYNSCLRLSKINHGLTLLAKIESGAYDNSNKINITNVLKNQVEHYIEAVELNQLSIKTELKQQIHFNINPDLIEILISNLIRNAIKHNISNGSIQIITSKNSIRFSNSGNKSQIDTNQFKRFNKSNKNSLGLGLSIISKICLLNNIQLKYTYENGLHNFDLNF